MIFLIYPNYLTSLVTRLTIHNSVKFVKRFTGKDKIPGKILEAANKGGGETKPPQLTKTAANNSPEKTQTVQTAMGPIKKDDLPTDPIEFLPETKNLETLAISKPVDKHSVQPSSAVKLTLQKNPPDLIKKESEQVSQDLYQQKPKVTESNWLLPSDKVPKEPSETLKNAISDPIELSSKKTESTSQHSTTAPTPPPMPLGFLTKPAQPNNNNTPFTHEINTFNKNKLKHVKTQQSALKLTNSHSTDSDKSVPTSQSNPSDTNIPSTPPPPPPQPPIKQTKTSTDTPPLAPQESFTEEIKKLGQQYGGDGNITPSKIIKAPSGKTFYSSITPQTKVTDFKQKEDLHQEAKNREILKDDKDKTETDFELTDDTIITVGKSKNTLKLTTVGQAYYNQYCKENPQANCFFIDDITKKADITFKIVIPPEISENTVVETGLQKHLLIVQIAGTNQNFVIGYLTSKNTGDLLCDQQFKDFQKQVKNNDQTSSTSCSKKQNCVMLKSPIKLEETDLRIGKGSDAYLEQISNDAQILLKDTWNLLKEKSYVDFNIEGISNEILLKMCQAFDANMAQVKPHPKTDEELKQQQKGKEKQKAKQEAKAKAKKEEDKTNSNKQTQSSHDHII